MTDILMPALSPTMEEGTLAKWLVKEGDTLSAGQVIAEIETDKATMEVEAVDEGVVEALLVPAGTEAVKVNAPIARLAGGDAPAANGGRPAQDAAAAGVAISKGNAGEDRAGDQHQRPPPGPPAERGCKRAQPSEGRGIGVLGHRGASGLDHTAAGNVRRPRSLPRHSPPSSEGPKSS